MRVGASPPAGGAVGWSPPPPAWVAPSSPGAAASGVPHVSQNWELSLFGVPQRSQIFIDGGDGTGGLGAAAGILSGLTDDTDRGAKDTQMAVAPPRTREKTDEQKAITEMVRQFADEQIIPNAEHYDHEDEFPEPIVEQMKELGLFGVTIPEEYGGMGLDLTTYAMIVEELSRGWISISGVVNTHFIGSYLLMKFGTDEQKENFLPKMATGEIRAAFSLSEPEVGSDVQGIKTTAKKSDDGSWEINGQKMWVTNGLAPASSSCSSRPTRRPTRPTRA